MSTIYRDISPRAIQCRHNACTLLADQGGSPADSHYLTTHDILQLVRNTVVMKKSIEEFNRVHVHRFATGRNRRLYSLLVYHENAGQLTVLPADKNSWPYFGNKPRSPHLIKPERARFVRGLYQLWSLVILEPKARHQRMESFCLKDFATLKDLTTYDDIMIYDKTVMDMQKADHGQLEGIYMELEEPWRCKFHRLLGDRRGPPFSTGYLGRMAIWNNNVEDPKDDVIRKRNPSLPDPDFSELWYDTPDEDLSD